MRVLVACERSGRVRDAFLAGGHDAVSCDLAATDRPGPHYQGDVRDVLYDGWDLVVAFPPCDHLAVSGAAWFERKRADGRQRAAIEFFMTLAAAPVGRVAVENPRGIMARVWRPADQIVQPWWFGHPYTKATCLWLRGLPRLTATAPVRPVGPFVSSGSTPQSQGDLVAAGIARSVNSGNADRARLRSETFEGLAAAMADQWGPLGPADVVAVEDRLF